MHSEHDLKEQSDAQIIVSRFPFRGEGCGGAPYGQALTGLRVLKFDGAVAPRVLKFDSGYAAEGCGGAP